MWPINFNIIDIENKTGTTFKVINKDKRDWGNEILSESLMLSAIPILYTSLKLDPRFFELYSIAMTLFSSPCLQHPFYEEIFANFYKALERFIAIEITGKKKRVMLNELLQVFKDLKAPDDILEEVKKVYVLRNSTVMHSVGNEMNIGFIEAGKCKTVLDFVLHTYLTRRARNTKLIPEDEKILSQDTRI